ncbi:hypothetical protein AB1L42_22245, partial [Thalassoglobus sp. JC818]|uniref:hypothetical protein n=1 Tax=Thalassoglobus sp. JC818 TaxID=3232136 RepID=UPI0034594CB0
LALSGRKYSSSEIYRIVSGKAVESVAFGLREGATLRATRLAEILSLNTLAIFDSSLSHDDIEYLSEIPNVDAVTINSCEINPFTTVSGQKAVRNAFRPAYIWFEESGFPSEEPRNGLSWMKPSIVSFSRVEIPEWVLEELVCNNSHLKGAIFSNCTLGGASLSRELLPCELSEKTSIRIQ